jgi:hypothetical protein
MTSHRRLPHILAILLAAVLLTFTFGALYAPVDNAVREAVASDPASAVPAFKHIFVIVFENKAYDQVIGPSRPPYINELAQQYGLARNYFAVMHPSLPNYFALTGGDTFGITANCIDCTLAQPNLIDQLEIAGKSWKAYMESMPRPCFVGDDGDLYRQKHNPFIYYDNIRTDPARCNKIVPFTQFEIDLRANALPNYVWITPNMCNDAHDCTLDAADTWLKTWVPQILQSPAWQDQGVLFITFEESSGEDQSGCCEYAVGGHVATLVISPLGKPGFASDVAYSHYSLLRTIEVAWGLPLMRKANCDCSPAMADFFR